jgi:hypothetical protein
MANQFVTACQNLILFFKYLTGAGCAEWITLFSQKIFVGELLHYLTRFHLFCTGIAFLLDW